MSGDHPALAEALHEHAAAHAPGASAIDVADVVRRSRARRLPAQLAIGAAAAVLVLGVGVVAVNGLGIVPPAIIAADGERDEAAEQPATDDATGGEAAPSTPVEACTADPATAPPNPLGLVLEFELADRSTIDAGPIEGVVRIVNGGAERVIGATSAHATVIGSREGVTIWAAIAQGPTSSIALDLEPGESVSFPASLLPVACGADPLAAGAYELAALVAVSPSSPASRPFELASEPSAVVLD